MAALEVQGLTKIYHQGFWRRRETFRLSADFALEAGQVVGVMGPNGSGKTTLFELITGSNTPDRGRVLCQGQDIHDVRYGERDRLAIHYHQSYQVRRFRRVKPAFLMQRASAARPLIHLFDEPQFNTQDGYIGFMLDFFRRLREEGRLVFVCLHPYERFHVEILREICERYFFIESGKLTAAADWPDLLRNEPVRRYLGRLADC
ncbi:MAG TPA: ATP-binding cassette domain-containing protein [Kiloniellaceae bacterium]|nr:ATP-binding cassette domain-containing protein [Kiloniellaceae bacterium]